MRRRVPKVDRLLAGAALVAIAAGIPSATAQGESAFSGYEAAASASGISVFPYAPGQVVERPVEATLSVATSTLSTGGQGFARASTFYPGSPLANLGAILQIINPDFPDTPPYPLVVESREFEGAKQSDKPGLNMSTDASPDASGAEAALVAFDVPDAVEIGSLRSSTETRLIDGTVDALARSTVKDVDLGGGAIHIDAVVSTATAGTDAGSGECDGAAEVSGLEIGGVPATIGPDGIEADGSPVVPGPGGTDQITEVLDATGIRLRLLGGDGECDGPDASQSIGGLLVEVPFPAVGAVQGTLNVILGSTSASAAALPATTVEQPPFVAPPDEDPPGPTTSVVPAAPVESGSAPIPDVSEEPVAEPTSTGTDDTTTQEAAPLSPGGPDLTPDETATAIPASSDEPYSFDGVPGTLVVGLLLLSLLAARGVARFVRRLSTLGVT